MATGKAIIATVLIDDYIKEHYPTTHAKVIAEKLGLRTKWVQNRAWLLNVTKNRAKVKEQAQEKVVDMKPTWKPKVIINGAVLRHVCY